MRVALETISAALNEEDIEGLLALGAPPDEYRGEAIKIQSDLEKLNPSEETEEQIADIVMRAWAHSFGPFSKDELQIRSPVSKKVALRIAGKSSARVDDSPSTKAHRKTPVAAGSGISEHKAPN